MSKYSLCEGSSAVVHAQWHIRRLTEKGQRLGGGVDTPSLCGHVKECGGWDLETEICQELFNRRYICDECWRLYTEMSG